MADKITSFRMNDETLDMLRAIAADISKQVEKHVPGLRDATMADALRLAIRETYERLQEST